MKNDYQEADSIANADYVLKIVKNREGDTLISRLVINSLVLSGYNVTNWDNQIYVRKNEGVFNEM